MLRLPGARSISFQTCICKPGSRRQSVSGSSTFSTPLPMRCSYWATCLRSGWATTRCKPAAPHHAPILKPGVSMSCTLRRSACRCFSCTATATFWWATRSWHAATPNCCATLAHWCLLASAGCCRMVTRSAWTTRPTSSFAAWCAAPPGKRPFWPSRWPSGEPWRARCASKVTPTNKLRRPLPMPTPRCHASGWKTHRPTR